MTDTPHIRRARDWPFLIPQITAEAIDELVDAIERGDRWTGSLYDELDGATREKRAHSPACPRPGPARGARCAPGHRSCAPRAACAGHRHADTVHRQQHAAHHAQHTRLPASRTHTGTVHVTRSGTSCGNGHRAIPGSGLPRTLV
ncbi:hypothetical protein [Bifidobacterium thermophilum]|uniref:hypothetical protein n=1 Tax=Bifidobacterium thermophilum TaxID=33905 RepID=UPI000C712286|nr:hypothetical protein [Bifidobacterium thermophilum]